MSYKVVPVVADAVPPGIVRAESLIDKNSLTKTQNKSKVYLSKKILLPLLGGLFAIALIIAVFFIVVTGITPCRFKTCHPNATCINNPFNAKCKCNYGFNGNGIDCDECGLAYPGASHHDEFHLYYSAVGDPVIPFSFPSTVQINFHYSALATVNGRVYNAALDIKCLGILINRRHVLTAASCIPKNITFMPYDFHGDGFTPNNFTVTVPVTFNEAFPDWRAIVHVFLGIYDYIYYTNTEITPTLRAHIDDIIIHESFNLNSLNDDLAIIRLRDRVELNQYSQLACLPSHEDEPFEMNYLAYNTSAFALGWSMYYNDNYDFSSIFTDFHMNIFNATNCSSLYSNTTDPNHLICAGEYEYLLTPPQISKPQYCNGYLGSPLFINKAVNGIQKWFAVGVSVNDTICGISVYTNLFHFVDWIEKNSIY